MAFGYRPLSSHALTTVVRPPSASYRRHADMADFRAVGDGVVVVRGLIIVLASILLILSAVFLARFRHSNDRLIPTVGVTATKAIADVITAVGLSPCLPPAPSLLTTVHRTGRHHRGLVRHYLLHQILGADQAICSVRCSSGLLVCLHCALEDHDTSHGALRRCGRSRERVQQARVPCHCRPEFLPHVSPVPPCTPSAAMMWTSIDLISQHRGHWPHGLRRIPIRPRERDCNGKCQASTRRAGSHGIDATYSAGIRYTATRRYGLKRRRQPSAIRYGFTHLRSGKKCMLRI